ncbi:MAG: TrkA family potassium uptake protein [Clostridia bacterium]|nr:TrkA family potassium uptake protein [Clostridia bacterium]
MKKKQYLVIGLGRFGSAVATTLQQQGMEVLAIDRDMEKVEAHRSLLTEVIRADAMEKGVLEQIGASNFDAAIVTIGGDVTASCTVTMLLKELGEKCVIVKAGDEFHGRMLSKLGADKVIFPERDMGQRIAHNLVSEKIMDFIELSPDYSLVEMRPNPEWVGKTLSELNLRARHRINVVAVRSGEQVNAMPDLNTRIQASDVMLVVSAAEER